MLQVNPVNAEIASVTLTAKLYGGTKPCNGSANACAKFQRPPAEKGSSNVVEIEISNNIYAYLKYQKLQVFGGKITFQLNAMKPEELCKAGECGPQRVRLHWPGLG